MGWYAGVCSLVGRVHVCLVRCRWWEGALPANWLVPHPKSIKTSLYFSNKWETPTSWHCVDNNEPNIRPKLGLIK